MKSYLKQRKEKALGLLKIQLEKGTKPVKGEHLPKLDADGNLIFTLLRDGVTKKYEYLEVVPMTTSDVKKKQTEIANLKRKLNIA